MSLTLALLLQVQPLPEKTDILPTFSTVVCPDEEAARMMLHSYHDVKDPPNNHTIDVTHFFAGLKQTGCVQNGPKAETVITIAEVIDRRTIMLAPGPSVIMAYRGTNANGEAVIGVVDESENNRFPRSPLEEFQQRWSPDGYLDATNSNEGWPVYRCPSFADASAAVFSIPDRGSEKTKERAFAKGRAKQKCVAVTSGRYTINSVGPDKTIDCGIECANIWTAVEVRDEKGVAAGLIFNTSEM